MELYNHIDGAEMDKVREQLTGKRTWYETQHQACQAVPKHENAPVTCAQIRAEVKVSQLKAKIHFPTRAYCTAIYTKITSLKHHSMSIIQRVYVRTVWFGLHCTEPAKCL